MVFRYNIDHQVQSSTVAATLPSTTKVIKATNHTRKIIPQQNLKKLTSNNKLFLQSLGFKVT